LPFAFLAIVTPPFYSFHPCIRCILPMFIANIFPKDFQGPAFPGKTLSPDRVLGSVNNQLLAFSRPAIRYFRTGLSRRGEA